METTVLGLGSALPVRPNRGVNLQGLGNHTRQLKMRNPGRSTHMQIVSMAKQDLTTISTSDNSGKPSWMVHAALRAAVLLPLAGSILGLNPGKASAAPAAQAQIANTVIDPKTGLPSEWVYSSGLWGQDRLDAIFNFYAEAIPSDAGPSARQRTSQFVKTAVEKSQQGLESTTSAVKEAATSVDVEPAVQWSKTQVKAVHEALVALMDHLQKLSAAVMATSAQTATVVAAKSSDAVGVASVWSQEQAQTVKAAVQTSATVVKEKLESSKNAIVAKASPPAPVAVKKQQQQKQARGTTVEKKESIQETLGKWKEDRLVALQSLQTSLKTKVEALKKPAAPVTAAKSTRQQTKKTAAVEASKPFTLPTVTLPKLEVPKLSMPTMPTITKPDFSKLTVPKITLPDPSTIVIDGPLSKPDVQKVVGAVVVAILGLLVAEKLTRKLQAAESNDSSSSDNGATAVASSGVSSVSFLTAAADGVESWNQRTADMTEVAKAELKAEAQRRIEAAKAAAARAAALEEEQQRAAAAAAKAVQQHVVVDESASITDRISSSEATTVTAAVEEAEETTVTKGEGRPMIAMLAFIASAIDTVAPLVTDRPQRKSSGSTLELIDILLAPAAPLAAEIAKANASASLLNGTSSKSTPGRNKYDAFMEVINAAVEAPENRGDSKFDPVRELLKSTPPAGTERYDFVRSVVRGVAASADKQASSGEKPSTFDMIGNLLKYFDVSQTSTKYDPVRELIHQAAILEGWAPSISPAVAKYDPLKKSSWIDDDWGFTSSISWDPMSDIGSIQAPTIKSKYDPMTDLLSDDWQAPVLKPQGQGEASYYYYTQETRYDPVAAALDALAGWRPFSWKDYPRDSSAVKYDMAAGFLTAATAANSSTGTTRGYDPIRWLMDGWAGSRWNGSSVEKVEETMSKLVLVEQQQEEEEREEEFVVNAFLIDV